MSWLVRDCLRSNFNRRFLRRMLRLEPNDLCVTERSTLAALLSNKWDEEVIPSYKPESFYPATIGETLNGIYQLIAKVGFGTTSTVWLATDARRWWWQQTYVALKISVNDLSPINREISLSEHIANVNTFHPGRQFVRTPLESFELQGPNGIHPVLVYDFMREPLSLSRERCVGNKFEPNLVKTILEVILMGLDYLHNECHVVHGDLSNGNVLVPIESPKILRGFAYNGLLDTPEKAGPDKRVTYLSQPDAGGFLSRELMALPKIIDFGASVLMGGDYAQQTQLTRYKAPELLLGTPFGYGVDIWNLGLMAWELLEGHALLEVCDPASGIRTEQMQLAEIIGLLGPPPELLRSRGSKSHLFFDSKGHFKFPELVPQPPSLKNRVNSLKKKDRSPFLDFVRSTLVWDPAGRKSAQELLRHPWLQDPMSD